MTYLNWEKMHQILVYKYSRVRWYLGRHEMLRCNYCIEAHSIEQLRALKFSWAALVVNS